MKLIYRKQYIERLLAVKNIPDIKVIIGIRRSGKSKLMDSYIDIISKDDSVNNQDKLNKGPEKKSYIIQKRRVKVFNLLKANKSLSKPKIAKELDITERQIKDVFDYLIDNGYIHHEGPAKGGEWIIDKEL